MKTWFLKHKKLSITLAIFTLLCVWHFSHQPSNERDWSFDQKILPYAEFNTNEVTVFNIRNFQYESVDKYISGYYDRTFKLDEITSVDYIVEPFNNLGAAHTFVSFGFENDKYLAISIEIRKEVGESFSAIKGVLRNYEIMYVTADERDAIKLRTNFRKDDVYLYPVNTTKENMKQLFVNMLTRTNKLKEKPEFYNTITNTCTTNIADHINDMSHKRIPWDLRLLLPKNSDMLAYELGLIDNSIPLEELRTKHKINDLAERYSKSENFSMKIRGH